MDQEIINRVSRAILETPNASDYEILVAKRAIEAMLEPNQAMISAAIDIGGEIGWGCYYSNYKNVYQAMIRKILGT